MISVEVSVHDLSEPGTDSPAALIIKGTPNVQNKIRVYMPGSSISVEVYAKDLLEAVKRCMDL